MPTIPQKNARFLCCEGLSIFSTDFKGYKNVILTNISKKRNQKSRARYFTTPHSNQLMSKITEKFCGILELKLKVGHKTYQM